MTINAQLADGRILEFPDGTNPAVIQNTVKSLLSQPAQAQQAPQVTPEPTATPQPQPQGGDVLNDLVEGFNQLPGVPELSEIAAGSNRTVAGVLDFLGPDTVNAVLELTGSDKRVPTISGSLPGIEGGFVEPGLKKDILSTSGEVLPAAVGIGALMRNLAAKLPALASGESTSAGLLRQAGQGTLVGDVGTAALIGTGEEVGREVAGEEGALVGGIATPLAAIPLTAAKNTASKLLNKSAPSIDEIKKVASGIYQSLDNSGVRVASEKFGGLVDDIARTLQKEGADPDLTPKATALVRRLTTEAVEPKTLSEIDTLRKVAQDAAGSAEKGEQRLGTIAINKIDDFLDDLGSDIGGKETGEAFKAARDLWGRAKKAELLDTAIVNAGDQASGFENGIRTQFRQLLKNINTGKQRGFTEEETAAIRKVAQGTKATNIAKFLGKFGILDGVTSRSLTTLSGAGLAGVATGSTGVAIAVPLVGQLSGALAERMTLNNAKMANSIIRAGKNGAQIASAYVRNTPKAQQAASELAELFIANKAPIEAFNLKKVSPLVADAAVIAAIALQNEVER